VKVQVQSPKFQKMQHQNNQTKVQVQARVGLQLPATSDWNNSLVEGQVEYYLTSGMDLWDHSTILPDWMKRECGWRYRYLLSFSAAAAATSTYSIHAFFLSLYRAIFIYQVTLCGTRRNGTG
jgi:hypothetical protein